MRHDVADFGHLVADEFAQLVEVADPGRDEIGLAAAVMFAQQRLAQHHRVPGHHIGAHREPVDRRGLDNRELTQARHRHLQRARDRRRGQRQHMDIGLERLQPLLVDDAEALFLVDDDQAQPLELDRFGEQRMRADDNIDGAIGQALARGLGLARGDEARKAADVERKALKALDEIGVMLARQQRRRCDDRDLHARHRGDERGAHRHLRLAEADIAADQPVHRLARGEVLEHFGDDALLVLGFLIGKAVDKARIDARLDLGDIGGAQGTLGGGLHQLARNRLDAFLELGTSPLPGFAAQLVERDALAFGAVAGEHVDILDRHIELVAARIGQPHAVVRALADRDRDQPLIAADAMVDMHDQVAGRERLQFGQERIGGLALLAPTHQPVAEQVLFGQDLVAVGGKAVILRQHDHRGHAGRGLAQRFLPASRQRHAREAMVLEQPEQPAARAFRIARDDRAAVRGAQLLDMRDGGGIDIVAARALRAEIARGAIAEAQHALRFGLVMAADQMDRRFTFGRAPFLGHQIERRGLERPIAARLVLVPALAVGVIVGDALEPLVGGGIGPGVAQHDIGIIQMLEQRHQPLLDHRQPVFHAGEPAPVADRLIERIGGGIGAERLAIGAAEALDAVGVEQHFGGGQQDVPLDPLGRTLRARIEGAHRVELVAEEIEPEPRIHPCGEDVDQVAAHRELARIGDGIGAGIALAHQLLDQRLARDHHAGFQLRADLADAERGQCALGDRVDRGDQQLRPARRLLQRPQSLEPPRGNAERGRGAVIGQAVPGGKFDRFQIGRIEGRGLGHRMHHRIVGRDEDDAPALLARGGGAGEVRQQQRQRAGRDARQRQRHGRLQDAADAVHKCCALRAGAISAEC